MASDTHNKALVLSIPLLLCLYLFLTSTYVLIHSLDVFNGKRFLELALLPVILAIGLLHPEIRQRSVARLRSTPKWILSLLGLFFLIGVISALRLDYYAYSLVEVGLLFVLLLMVIIVASCRELLGDTFDRWVLAFISLTIAAIAIQELMGMVTGWMAGQEFGYLYLFVYFSHPRFFNQLQSWTLPVLALLPVVFKDKPFIRSLCVIVLSLNWYLLFVSGGRASLLSLTLALVVVTILFPKSRTAMKWHLAGIALGAGIFLLTLWGHATFTQSADLFANQSINRELLSSSGRNAIWAQAWNDALHHPWLGTGPGWFACGADGWMPAHAHNSLLQIAGEWGLIATAILLMILLWSARSLFLASRQAPTPALLVLTGLIAAAIHAGLSGILIMPTSQIAGCLIAGWWLGFRPSHTAKQDIKSNKTSFKPSYFIFALGFVISLGLIYFSAVEVGKLTYRTQQVQSYGFTTPRFWLHGKLCLYQQDVDPK